MIPTPPLVLLVALGVPLVLLGLLGSRALTLAAVYNGIVLVAVLLDVAATASPRFLEAERRQPLRWVQGRPDEVCLDLAWNSDRVGRLTFRDLPPVSFEGSGRPARLLLQPRQRTLVRYGVVPQERGVQEFGALAVRSRGPLGLMARQRVIDLSQRAKVYPDLVSLSAREASLVVPSTWHLGVRRSPMVGEGREFHQLRDYVTGDDARLLDWKAFAHRGRLTVRDYRVERNQRVLLLIDAGRLMTARVADRLRFDWAVQAAGRLARVVLAMGDVVGMAFFSRDVRAHLAPSRGPGHLNRMAELMAEARPSLDEPDLGRSLRTLLRRYPRRTLVVLFTELADPSSAEAIQRHIGGLAPRHLGLVVTLADADLEAERDLPQRNVDAVYRKVAADELWVDSRKKIRALETRGALVVRARADALAGEAVERYLEIKRRGRL